MLEKIVDNLTLVLAVVALLIFVAIAPFACVNEEDAARQLQREGYTNVEFSGYEWFGCGRDDFYSTGFNATKNGQAVHGVVCKGLFKGSTIRYY